MADLTLGSSIVENEEQKWTDNIYVDISNISRDIIAYQLYNLQSIDLWSHANSIGVYGILWPQNLATVNFCN